MRTLSGRLKALVSVGVLVAIAIVAGVCSRAGGPFHWQDYGDRVDNIPSVMMWLAKARPDRTTVLKTLGPADFDASSARYFTLNDSGWKRGKVSASPKSRTVLVYYVEEHGQDLFNSKLPSHLIVSFDRKEQFLSCEIRHWDADF